MLSPLTSQRKDAKTQRDVILEEMRYLVTARVKPGQEGALANAI